jgi:hypothetical protein
MGLVLFQEPYIGLGKYELPLWLIVGGACLLVHTFITGWSEIKRLFYELMNKMLGIGP